MSLVISFKTKKYVLNYPL